ncbi:hypothetical protein [uncultured Rhodoblastus sp.]|uniref:hypothetical protein n=1 Tax=uncultured Rhodoblastus sp. TaxID=543037 RepID=UPI0026007A12|nr:hypothetical protein [uncultured Rhodoblastus sp.]
MRKNRLARRIAALEERGGGKEDVWVIFYEIVRPDLSVMRGNKIRSHDGVFCIERAPNESDQEFECRALADAEQFARANDHALTIFHELEL